MNNAEERLLKHFTDAFVKLTHQIGELVECSKPLRRFIRLQVVGVRFVQPELIGTHMSENIGIDIPAGKIARVQFKPVDERGKPTKIDGPVVATVLEDPTQPTQPPAEVAVGGVDGLFVDIKLPDTEGSLASVEVGGDPNPAPGREDAEVLTTLITVRQLGDIPGKAVSLGAKPETVTFPEAGAFGQF